MGTIAMDPETPDSYSQGTSNHFTFCPCEDFKVTAAFGAEIPNLHTACLRKTVVVLIGSVL